MMVRPSTWRLPLVRSVEQDKSDMLTSIQRPPLSLSLPPFASVADQENLYVIGICSTTR